MARNSSGVTLTASSLLTLRAGFPTTGSNVTQWGTPFFIQSTVTEPLRSIRVSMIRSAFQRDFVMHRFVVGVLRRLVLHGVPQIFEHAGLTCSPPTDQRIELLVELQVDRSRNTLLETRRPRECGSRATVALVAGCETASQGKPDEWPRSRRCADLDPCADSTRIVSRRRSVVRSLEDSNGLVAPVAVFAFQAVQLAMPQQRTIDESAMQGIVPELLAIAIA